MKVEITFAIEITAIVAHNCHKNNPSDNANFSKIAIILLDGL